MMEKRLTLAGDIRDLVAKLTAEGWDRLRGVRLIHLFIGATAEARRSKWLEGVGRAESLVQVMNECIREAPDEDRLRDVLRSAEELAELLAEGHYSREIDPGILPQNPGEWTLLILGNVNIAEVAFLEVISALGFKIEVLAGDEIPKAAILPEKSILLAGVRWLNEHAASLAGIFPKDQAGRLASPFLVAIADTDDFRAQVKVQQMGACLLLDPSPDASRLIAELAGLAWVPRKPYRALLIDDDNSVLELHASILRNAGFEVLAMDDPVAAHEFLVEFSPEICVLDVEMPSCRGTDLAALLRRDRRYSRLPVIYLSAFDDISHQLDARYAGGEDYLVKPVDARLLIAAAMSRARQFRMLEQTNRMRRAASAQVRNLRYALDSHAMISVTTSDGSIVDVNHRFCAASGYDRQELIGRNHRIVKSGHHAPKTYREMWTTLAEGRIWHGEVQNRHKNGSSYWVQSTIVPILDGDGTPEQFVAIHTEISEQKRVQDERARQGRLLDAIRQSLQSFILSNNLESTSILLLDAMLRLTGSTYGFIGEVLYEPSGKPFLKTHALDNVAWDDDTRRLYEEARTHGMEFRDLDSLFGTVLTTGKTVIVNDPDYAVCRSGLPTGHPQLESFVGVPIRFGDTLIGMVGLTNRPGGYDNASVEFMTPLVAAYATILEAARLRNFQQNVILDLQQSKESMEGSGAARDSFLKAWECDLRTTLNTAFGMAQILLLNEGMDAEATAQAREIVRCCEQLSKQINLLRDRINVTPTAAAAPGPGIPRAMVSAAREGARRRILVAEDNPANQAVMRMQLNVIGYDVDIAIDGTTALAKWQAGGHDLIMTDRNMPGMDGMALTRAIRATEQANGGHIPIIGTTAASHPDELASCRDAGMDDVLGKPIELDDLRRLLATWLPTSLPARSAGETARGKREQGAILDANHLAGILGSTNAGQVSELVDLFTATAHAELPGCRKLLTEGNGRSLALIMHKLKSSARMVGAMRFAVISERLEDCAKAGDFAKAASLLSELEHAIGDVEDAALQITLLSPFALSDSRDGLDESLPRRVLVVDDDPVVRRQTSMLLAAMDVGETRAVAGGRAALAELGSHDAAFDLIIFDLNMPEMDGIELLRQLAEIKYPGQLVICSGVEDRLLQTAADLTLTKGLNLRGTLRKPITWESLRAILCASSKLPNDTAGASVKVIISAQDIVEGIRHDAFSVHFQPKVEAGTLRVVGVEALARWQHNGVAIPPDTFIAVAEKHGLIATLSEVLVTKAIIGGAQLAGAGFPLSVAVNLSATWLSDIRLPEFIQASIHATGFQADRLILEITETSLMQDVVTSMDVLTRLRLKGFQLSIDDFGTGYSSLEQLQRIPFCELKIDRSLVHGAGEKPATRAILASSLELARKLNLSTVAEGVETEADLDLVRGLGCDLVQGWLVARAMPIDELLLWLRTGNAH